MSEITAMSSQFQLSALLGLFRADVNDLQQGFCSRCWCLSTQELYKLMIWMRDK